MNRNDIKALRKTLGLSQKELAEKIGVDRSTIGSWERGVNFPTKKYAGNLEAMFADCPPLVDSRQCRKKKDYDAEEEALKELAKNLKAITHLFTTGKIYIITERTNQQEMQSEYTAQQQPILRYEGKEGIHHVFREIRGKWIVTYTDAQLIGKKIKEVDINGNGTS